MGLRITLDALLVLDAIERRQSFAAAAAELHRVPSAVSYTVAKLEEDLGVELFDRRRRRAELTATGRLVLEQGRRILKAAHELTEQARQAADGWEVELRICVESVLSCDAIYALIAEFQTLQPKTQIRLSEEVLSGSWDALIDDRCDLVVGAEGRPPAAGLAHYTLGEVVFDFAVAATHPLASRPTPLPMTIIQNYPTVIVADSSQRLPTRSAGLLDGRSRIYVPSIEHKIEAQCKGIGVGYLPRHRIKQELSSGQLVLLELEVSRPPVEIALAWRKNNPGKALKWFVERLQRMQFSAEQSGLVDRG